MFTYFIPLTVNLTKNSKLEKFVHELIALWKLSGSSMGALRELVAVAGMLVLLKMVYPRGSIKFHIIGIVPVTVNNEINMHIVEGCHPEKKTILLNKANLIWCYGECESYSVDQFVAFVPGKDAVEKLKKGSIKCNTTDHHKWMYYGDAEGGKTLSASIAPQFKKIKS